MAALHESPVADVGGGGDQAVHVDLGPFREGDAALIDDDDVAVGLEPTRNDRGIGSHHPVQRDGRGRRLVEPGGFSPLNVERPPLDDRPVALLVDVEMAMGAVADGRASADHLPAFRIGERRPADGDQHAQRRPGQRRPCKQALLAHQNLTTNRP